MSFDQQKADLILAQVPVQYPDLSDITRGQVLRWGKPFLDWCIATKTRPTAADRMILDRYEQEAPERFGGSRPVVRSQLKKVLSVADRVLAKPRGSGGLYAARYYAVPDRGRLPDAIARVMTGARDDKHRRQLRTTLGRFLDWCDVRMVRAEDCGEADLYAYRRSLQKAGLKSTGPELDAAKRLLQALGLMAPK